MSESKRIYDKPLLFWVLKLFFPVADPRTTVVTFGDKVYYQGTIPNDLWAHEVTHNEQQRFSNWYATWWWIKYICSKRFRYKQELKAYRAQYLFARRHYTIQDCNNLLDRIAKDLSGPLYGNLVTYNQAREQIKK